MYKLFIKKFYIEDIGVKKFYFFSERLEYTFTTLSLLYFRLLITIYQYQPLHPLQYEDFSFQLKKHALDSKR